MSSESQVILGLIIGVILLVYLVVKTKIHVFLALIIAAAITGIIGGMSPPKVADAIIGGFGSTLGSIGIVIGFGVMMGRLLEVSGAAERLAYALIKFIGKKKEEWAMALAGYIVAIPIFVDSTFIILTPLIKSVARKTGKSVVAIGIPLAIGAVATHHAVPPTPGPLGVAGIFGVDIGQMIIYGLIFAIPIMLVGVFYGKWLGKRIYQLPNEDGTDWVRPEDEMTYDEFVQLSDERNKELPSLFRSILPIVLPIVLIFLNTTLTALEITGGIYDYLIFLGQPIIAVGLAVIAAIYALAGRWSREDTLARMEEGMNAAGVILLITGAGGAFGYVLRESGAGDYIGNLVASLPLPAVLIPFIVASLIRLIQGSGTVAMITAASISAPILVNIDGVNMVLAAQAAALGAMVFSYFSDTMFWVVNRSLGITNTKEQIMVWSVPTTLAWGASLIAILVADIFV
ncbi:gluconate:H+ symporter, GntP family [Psychrobacillus psychrotolerans]|uniref:Gluconate:H+ symporter, GntP family n=1 Tax=Psychrobacillus psychrotolerans TaxID=126156 RepID=A0A1I5VMY7_9BACI|nr:gluconate:H+ symporter [Psychrobacillus psychrotolerans]SFQ08803.1 gluconate:H+ symporter, GntP family [Psychrobacillus psychrotolerans]